MPSLAAVPAQTVICDNGTGFVKCGFAGDEAPQSIFPCMVGRRLLRYDAEPSSSATSVSDVVVGAECAAQAGSLEVCYPMTDGIVTHWDDMHRVWDHTFEEVLHVDTREPGARVMLTTPPLNPTAARLRMLETMFERYGFSALSLQVQAGLVLYAQGLLTGLVLDSGDGVTHAVPVVDGHSFPHLTRRINVAGRHVTAHLTQLLQRRGYALGGGGGADADAVRRLKERACFVALDFPLEAKLARETAYLAQTYTLPDGRTIRVAAERFAGPEALFQPALLGVEGDGLSDLVFKCIQENAVDNRARLFQHVVLSGGCTMLPGLPARLERDLRRLYLSHVLQGRREGLKGWKLRVDAAPKRQHLVFRGASVLAEIMAGEAGGGFWVTAAEWQEDPHRALRKCDGLIARQRPV